MVREAEALGVQMLESKYTSSPAASRPAPSAPKDLKKTKEKEKEKERIKELERQKELEKIKEKEKLKELEKQKEKEKERQKEKDVKRPRFVFNYLDFIHVQQRNMKRLNRIKSKENKTEHNRNKSKVQLKQTNKQTFINSIQGTSTPNPTVRSVSEVAGSDRPVSHLHQGSKSLPRFATDNLFQKTPEY